MMAKVVRWYGNRHLLSPCFLVSPVLRSLNLDYRLIAPLSDGLSLQLLFVLWSHPWT